MWIADNWKDYEVIDCSGGEKLERWGRYILLRPDPQVIWNTDRKCGEWKKLNAHYHRSSKGGGEWEFFDLPEQWSIDYRDLKFNLKPFSFKHTGLFPEQAVNWDWMRELISGRIRNKSVDAIGLHDGCEVAANDAGSNSDSGKSELGRLESGKDGKIKVLNLFAYTGGATVACAKAGAAVTHVDASKGMVGWAKENAAASGLADAPIRYIVDDCKKFVEREIRRGNRYDAIIMDPPSYGRGPGGEIWKLEESLYPFVELCAQVLTDDPLFVLINSYTTGLAPAVLSYMLGILVKNKFGGHVEAEEIGLPVTRSGLVLPCGASGRWYR